MTATIVRLGDEQQVNTHTPGHQRYSSVTALADGGWLVTWSSLNQDGSSWGVYQQRYNADGNPDTVKGETRVNTTTASPQQQPSVTALKDGGWLVTWVSTGEDGLAVHQQRYDQNGVAVGVENRVDTASSDIQQEPSVTGLADGGWLVTWTSLVQDQSGIFFDVFQRRFTPVVAFGEGKEQGTGTQGDDVFQVRNGGLSAGDSLEAGGGIDILQMIEAGTLDLNAATLLTGIEIVQGSSGNDVILADGAGLGAIIGFRGGSGTDALHLKAGNYDFTTKLASGFEAITLLGTGSITFADKATALLARSQTQDGTVILAGDSFTLAERTQLYAQGIRKVTDAGGVHILQEAQASLSMRAVEENAGTGTTIGILSATDPNPGDGIRFELIDSAGGRFALSGNQVVVANGKLLDYELASAHRIVVRVIDDGGIAIDKAFTITLSDVPVETFKGSSHADVIEGGAGRDVLFGGLGKDTLSGGDGQDAFVFDTKPNKSANLDRITDFDVKDDAIWLDNKIFTKLGKSGSVDKPVALKKGYFATDKAKDKDDYLIYNKKTGALSYDADGTGTKYKAIELALLKKGLGLKANDFFVI